MKTRDIHWDKQACLKALRECCEDNGGWISRGIYNAWRRWRDVPSISTISERFGMWSEAVAIVRPVIERKCLWCGDPFVVERKEQRFCSRAHSWAHKQDRTRRERRIAGLCLQCGGKMDFPPSRHQNKPHPQYCSKCQEYFRSRHQKMKGR